MDKTIPLIILGVILVLVLIILKFSKGSKKKRPDDWVSDEAFRNEKMKLRPGCSEAELRSFMDFLSFYKGGYVKRSSGRIVHQEYLGREKGDLKGIFFHVVVPNPNLSVPLKEEFREMIICLGVSGVEKRPSYETRDSKLRNREKDEDDFQRKEVGNQGEQTVRDALGWLNPLKEMVEEDYSVINGPVLKCGNTVKEFDHIVVGKTGIFVIETKAFGMTDGKPSKASLFIDKGDKWILRKHQKNRELTSPTQQLKEETEQLSAITGGKAKIHAVLALSNTELFVKQNISLPYEVIRADQLTDHIRKCEDSLVVYQRQEILRMINECRIN